MAFQYLKGTYKKDGEGCFTRTWNGRTKGNGFKLKENRFSLDSRTKICTVRVIRHRNSGYCPEKLWMP